MYTVVLSFESAKLPFRAGTAKDKINEFGFTKNRENFISETKPINISFETISNVIHVLCGCRPAPTYRKSYLKRISQIDDIAKSAMYKISNNITCIDNNGNIVYIKEFTEGKNGAWNSQASNMMKTVSSNGIGVEGFFTWSGLYKRYGIYKKDVYDKIINIFEKIYGKSYEDIHKEYSLIDFLIELRKDNYDKTELISFLTDIKCTPIKDFVLGKDKALTGSLHFNSSRNLNALCVNSSPVKKISFDGEIVFSIDEKNEFSKNLLKTIIEGTRHATLFDGGLVCVKEITSYDIDNEAYMADGFLNVEL